MPSDEEAAESKDEPGKGSESGGSEVVVGSSDRTDNSDLDPHSNITLHLSPVIFNDREYHKSHQINSPAVRSPYVSKKLFTKSDHSDDQ